MGLLPFGTPFGFMAFLGVASLAGVIVSHVIVLFDYIEEACERGEPLRQAVIDSGLVRLRPVLVTVLATVGGLIPLAIEGGPLWEPMCYVQIAGLLLGHARDPGHRARGLRAVRREPQTHPLGTAAARSTPAGTDERADKPFNPVGNGRCAVPRGSGKTAPGRVAAAGMNQRPFP